MSVNTDFNPSDLEDKTLNPAEQFSDSEQEMLGRMRKHLKDAEKNAAGGGDKKSPDDQASLGNAEREEGTKKPGFTTDLAEPKQNIAPKKGFFKGKKARYAAIFGGIGAGGSIVGLIFFAMMPLKLESMIQTAADKFGAVPEYAIQQRMEYLTTRWLATRTMQIAHPDSDIVFCAGGGILCHLGNTKYNQWFEEKLDAKLEKSGQKVKVTLNASGRTALGGKATTLEMSLGELGDHESAIKGIRREIDHKKARSIIKQQVKTVHSRNYLMRFISKGNLMRKYGIKRFNIIPEKTAKNIAEYKANMKAKMLKNTIGKISTKMAAYMGCLSGGDAIACEKTIKELSNKLAAETQKAQEDLNNLPADGDRDAAEGRVKSAQEKENLFKDVVTEADGKATGRLSEIFANTVVKRIVAGAGILGFVDLAMTIVSGFDMLPTIRQDLAKTTYAAFAYDEDYGSIVTNDMMKAGDPDVMMQLEAATSLFDGAEKAPLYAAMNGLSRSTTGNIVTECEDGDNLKLTTLDPGELVCPEQKIVAPVGEGIRNIPGYTAVQGVAGAWNSTLGKVFRAMDAITGAIIDNTVGEPLSAIGSAIMKIPPMAALGDEVGEFVSKAVNKALFPPSVGPTASGSQNYVGQTFAIQDTINSGMEYGQESGDGLKGGGGIPLGDTTVSQILQETRQQNYDDFQSRTMLAKIFDTSSEFSIAYKLLAYMPTSNTSALTFLMNTPSTIVSNVFTKNISAATVSAADMSVLKASGLPVYGFVAGDPILEADPSIYTPEFCKASAEAREESYSDKNGYLVPTYAKSDPCALEKVIGGMMANEIGDTEDPNYIQEPDAGSGGSADQNTGGAFVLPEGASKNWARPNSGSQTINANYRSIEYFNALGFDHTGVDLDNAFAGDVFAACDGVVEEVNITPNISDLASTSSNSFVINCGGGIQVTNSHTKNTLGLSKGSQVKAGDKIGETDLSGITSGAHVHFGVRINNEWTDPVPFMKDRGVTLGTCNGGYCAQH